MREINKGISELLRLNLTALSGFKPIHASKLLSESSFSKIPFLYFTYPFWNSCGKAFKTLILFFVDLNASSKY